MLETSINKLTKAVEELTETIRSNGGTGSAPAATTPETPKPEPAQAAKPEPEPTPTPEPEPEPAATPADDVTLKDVTAKVLELGKAKGRQAAVQLLGEYGATKVPDLKKTPDKYGEIVAKIDGLLAS